MNCQETQQLIIEFIEGSLDADKTKQFLLHTERCKICQTELMSLQQTISKTKSNIVPQPDKVFFKSFPDQVLSSYKAQADIKSSANHTRDVPYIIQIIQNWWLKSSNINMFAQALLVMLMIGGTFYIVNNSSNSSFNTLELYSNLQNNLKASQYIKKYRSNGSNNHFGFANKPLTSISYRAGELYSEILAALSVNQTNSASVKTDKLLAILAIQDNPKLIQAFEKHSTRINQNKATTLDKLTSFIQLRASLEEHIKQNGSKHITFFRIGNWLFDIKLVIATGAYNKLQQASQAQDIIDSLTMIDSPESIIQKFIAIKNIMAKNSISEQDAKKINTLTSELQQLFG